MIILSIICAIFGGWKHFYDPFMHLNGKEADFGHKILNLFLILTRKFWSRKKTNLEVGWKKEEKKSVEFD